MAAIGPAVGAFAPSGRSFPGRAHFLVDDTEPVDDGTPSATDDVVDADPGAHAEHGTGNQVHRGL
jgi:hypothetical protein